MAAYKILTQKDRFLSGKFDPATLENALNSYAQEGWKLVAVTSASFPGFMGGNREEMIMVLERDQ